MHDRTTNWVHNRERVIIIPSSFQSPKHPMIIIQLISHRNLNSVISHIIPVIPRGAVAAPGRVKIDCRLRTPEARGIEKERIRGKERRARRYSRVCRISTISFAQTSREYSRTTLARRRRRRRRQRRDGVYSAEIKIDTCGKRDREKEREGHRVGTVKREERRQGRNRDNVGILFEPFWRL